jgi:hypothetical protein
MIYFKDSFNPNTPSKENAFSSNKQGINANARMLYHSTSYAAVIHIFSMSLGRRLSLAVMT